MNYKKLSKITDAWGNASTMYASCRIDGQDIVSMVDRYTERYGVSVDFDKIYENIESFKDNYDVRFIEEGGYFGFADDDGLMDDIREIDDTSTRDLFVAIVEDIENDPNDYFKELDWEEAEPDWDSLPGGHDYM